MSILFVNNTRLKKRALPEATGTMVNKYGIYVVICFFFIFGGS